MITKVLSKEIATPPAVEVMDTPNTPTIDSLVEVMNKNYGGGFSAGDTLKNILLMADGVAISVLVPGNREVDVKRLQANLSGVKELRLFEEADFETRKELVKGYEKIQKYLKNKKLKPYLDKIKENSENLAKIQNIQNLPQDAKTGPKKK
jgi:hypothetical protein